MNVKAPVLAVLMLTLLVSSCEMLADPVEPASEWYVSLPAREGTASSSDWTQDDVVRYTVMLRQNGRTVLTKDGSPGERIQLSSVAPGVYDIVVEGFNDADEVIADGGGTASLEKGKTASITITLTLRSNDHLYTVAYKVNADGEPVAGTLPSDTEYQYHDSVTVQFPALTRTGYDFDGWNTSADGSGTAYRSDGTTSLTVKTSDITLYAQWIVHSYTVAFSAGTGVSVTGTTTGMSLSYNQTKRLSANGFVRTGYDFAGWSATDGGLRGIC